MDIGNMEFSASFWLFLELSAHAIQSTRMYMYPCTRLGHQCLKIHDLKATDLLPLPTFHPGITELNGKTPGLWGMYKRSEPIKLLHSVQNHMANVYSSEVCLQTKNFPKISKFFFFQKHSKI